MLLLLKLPLYHSALGMLTGCWQQAFSIRGQHFNGRGFPMMFSRSFPVHAGFAPRFGSVSAADFRRMAAALAVSTLKALEANFEKQLVRLARHSMARALRGARFAGAVGTADSMVAAGGR
jgi:hypothetical protein